MDTLNANEAKTQFGEMLMRVQRSPIKINKNGKPVAIVLSIQEYEELDEMKKQLLKVRALKARKELEEGQAIDGNRFFSEMEADKYD